jgi:hypothetical protein
MKCFDAHQKFKVSCEKRSCRYWINHKDSMNCTFLAARRGSMTLQEIGDIFNVTRMRICQLEKRILKKINQTVNSGPDKNTFRKHL